VRKEEGDHTRSTEYPLRQTAVRVPSQQARIISAIFVIPLRHTEPQELQLLPSVGVNREPTIRSFQSLVGSLLWIARCIRPDISFAVHKATRHTHQPRTSDWKLAKRIVRYLKATKTLKLRMDVGVPDGRCIQVESWSDADFAADKGDRKSVTGCVVAMNGVIVHWICKKQTGVSLHTMKAEFTSASHVGRELLGLRELERTAVYSVLSYATQEPGKKTSHTRLRRVCERTTSRGDFCEGVG
jgi:hypothetical protein